MRLSMFSPRGGGGGGGDSLGINQQKITSPGNLTEHFDTGKEP